MSEHQFLSNAWIEAARRIHAEYDGRVPTPDVEMRANVVVTEVPFDDGEVRGFIDTTMGSLTLEYGELDSPELTVTTDYTTARALFVSQDIAKLMESFMMGKILVTGDVTRLLAWTPPIEPEQLALADEIAARLEAITAS